MEIDRDHWDHVRYVVVSRVPCCARLSVPCATVRESFQRDCPDLRGRAWRTCYHRSLGPSRSWEPRRYCCCPAGLVSGLLRYPRDGVAVRALHAIFFYDRHLAVGADHDSRGSLGEQVRASRRTAVPLRLAPARG